MHYGKALPILLVLALLSAVCFACVNTPIPQQPQEPTQRLAATNSSEVPGSTAPNAAANHWVLTRDTIESSLSINAAPYWYMTDGHGQWVKFDAPVDNFQINKVTILGKRTNSPEIDGRNYTINIWSRNFGKLLFSQEYPYNNFSNKMALVENKIDPPLIISGDFIVDFVSNSVYPGDDKRNTPDTAIFLASDFSVPSNNNMGLSNKGTNAEGDMQWLMVVEPKFAHATWVIRVDGSGKPADKVAIANSDQTSPINPPPLSNQTESDTTGAWIHDTLRYDYLNSEEQLYSQIAVWHSYMTITYSNWALEGSLIKTPQIILPRKEGKVFLYRDYAGLIKYKQLGSTSCNTIVDDKIVLYNPGWGLATEFTPLRTPYKIDKILLCAVSNHDGLLSEYPNYHVLIRIFDKDGIAVWSKLYDWEYFRNKSTGEPANGPKASWYEIPVSNVEVTGDFYVDILSDSMNYPNSWQQGGYHYLAVAYEKVSDCNSNNAHSFISENSKRADPYIGLYDNLGNKICFNLCIRVEGRYLNK